MTVAELLSCLASDVVNGRAEWEVDVAILKTNPSVDESLRDFGNSEATATNTKLKKVYILSVARPLGEGEL